LIDALIKAEEEKRVGGNGDEKVSEEDDEVFEQYLRNHSSFCFLSSICARYATDYEASIGALNAAITSLAKRANLLMSKQNQQESMIKPQEMSKEAAVMNAITKAAAVVVDQKVTEDFKMLQETLRDLFERRMDVQQEMESAALEEDMEEGEEGEEGEEQEQEEEQEPAEEGHEGNEEKEQDEEENLQELANKIELNVQGKGNEVKDSDMKDGDDVVHEPMVKRKNDVIGKKRSWDSVNEDEQDAEKTQKKMASASGGNAPPAKRARVAGQ